MNPKRAAIYSQIDLERDYQDHQWGGPDHDKQHSAWDWANYITKYHGKFVDALMNFYDVAEPSRDSRSLREARKQLVKVAALAVAALENAPDLQEDFRG